MVRQVVKLFYREIRGLHQAAYLLALFAFGSQILAIVRDRMLAHTFGAGPELDVYYAAFRVPDLLFVVFASVLSVYVLIPFVSRTQKTDGDAAAATLLSNVFSFFLIGYVILAAVLFAAAPLIAQVLFPGFDTTSSDTLVTLLRILLLQPFLLGVSSLAGVITQMNKRFVIYAISPILYNAGIICGVVFFYPTLGLPGLVWGVVLGAAAHLGVQLPILRKSPLRFRFAYPHWVTITKIIKVAIPRAVTLSLNQVVLLVLTILATSMAVGSVSVFQFAFNLQSVPLTIIGVSYSVAAFPVLASFLAGHEFAKFRQHMQTAFRHIIFWSLPVVALVVILRAHIVRITLGSGNFSWDDTRLTAAILAVFVIALLSQAINLLAIRAFYANGDTRTPLIVALIGSAGTLAVAVVGYQYLYHIPGVRSFLEQALRLSDVPGTEVVMLAVGFAVGVTIQALLMLACLHRTFRGILRPLRRSLFNSILAAVAGGFSTYLTLQFVVKGINQETFIGIFLQASTAATCGIVTMYLIYYFLRSPELLEIHRAIARRINRTSRNKTITPNIL